MEQYHYKTHRIVWRKFPKWLDIKGERHYYGWMTQCGHIFYPWWQGTTAIEDADCKTCLACDASMRRIVAESLAACVSESIFAKVF